MTDDALAAMRHGELVAMLNRLYAAAGEPAITASTASASSDGELRDRIRGVRRRLLAKASGRPPADPLDAPPAAERPRRARPTDDVPTRRPFVVLVSEDQALARRARASCGPRGVVLVWVASQATFAKLVTSVTPTYVVIEGAADRIDDASVRELSARGVRFRWCRSTSEALDALAEIE
ncbi:MAG: hypothetical protein HS111_06915 [Kofleriaceae bacterium]|nr:hypothetical protein [Kofleriaceae bacterium]